ncbi:hypothetical protein AYO21_00937 [Fonsecaea monophora]|uniref:NAD-dependent epimerase/dehydratase domain-containing protein n=1 Tax=Fonsecaea monophora TaxID=254056 RepID=A0A177FL71_9EURO|nr:hypothetical protein AYO21_00937 [Fonsecaea monophora]OAG44975.1 hypothetical protein AYO21_00937 [Fonsecaea monophora]
MAPPRVLLTGANGFVGGHLLSFFLEKSCSMQAVVRPEAKAKRVTKDFPGYDRLRLDFSIVSDITAPGAFDQCIKDAQPLDAIIHAASPLNFAAAKSPGDFIDPAIHGTTEILKSTAKYAPGLKRLVITSSFAAIGNPLDLQGNGRVYSSESWNPVTKEAGILGGSWEFVTTEKPGFELVVLNPPIVYGPLRHIDSMSDLNTSNAILWRLMNAGKGAPVPDDSLHISVDVRDLSLSHYQAAFAPEKGISGARLEDPPGNPGQHALACGLVQGRQFVVARGAGCGVSAVRNDCRGYCKEFVGGGKDIDGKGVRWGTIDIYELRNADPVPILHMDSHRVHVALLNKSASTAESECCPSGNQAHTPKGSHGAESLEPLRIQNEQVKAPTKHCHPSGEKGGGDLGEEEILESRTP